MKHNGRKKGLRRERVTVFLKPELLYILEYIAVQQGYQRENRTTLHGRADVSMLIEDLLWQYFNMEGYTLEQRAYMCTNMLKIIEDRKSA